MRIFNLRLTEKQYKIAKKLADNQQVNVSQILRKAINDDFEQKGFLSTPKERGEGVPRYQVLTTSSTVETLILLRKIAEQSSPELVEVATELAAKQLNDKDLMAILKT